MERDNYKAEAFRLAFKGSVEPRVQYYAAANTNPILTLTELT